MSTHLNRRAFLGASIATMAGASGLGLSGCTGVSSGPATQGNGTGSKKLTLFTYEDTSTLPLLKAACKRFDKQHGTTTTINDLPGSGAAIYPDKLRTELLGGSGPDLWRIWGGQIGAPYVKARQAMDLSKYYTKYKWADRIDNHAIAGMTFYGIKGGVPVTIAGMGAWCNKKQLAKAKVTSIPTSYAEVEEMNAKLVSAGITPCGQVGKYGWDLMRLFEYLLEASAGPQLHDALLAGKESWNRPEVVQAFTRFKKWNDKGWLLKGELGLDPSVVEPEYVSGKVAYVITGTWTEAQAIQTANADESNYEVFELPTDHSPQRHSGFVEGYMINAKSPNADNAAALIDYLVQPATQKALKATASTVTGAQPDSKKYPLAAHWAATAGKHPFYTVQDQAFPKQQADQYFAVQSSIMQGNITPAQAAAKMQSIVSAWVKGS